MNCSEILDINGVHKIVVDNISGLFRGPRVLVEQKEKNGDVPNNILKLLMNPTIRRGDGLIYSSVQSGYLQKISNFVDECTPLQIVFQGLPFKCNNPVETMRRTPDLGEIAFLLRLGDINETIKQIYKPGVRFTILTEGNSYKKLFGATDKEVVEFDKKCIEYSQLLGLDQTVSFIDILSLVGDRVFYEGEVKKRQEHIFTQIEKSGTSEEIEHFIPVMSRSLPIIGEVSFEDLLSVFGYSNGVQKLTEFQKDFAVYLKNAATELVVRYLAIQRVKKDEELIQNSFPDYLYFSTTSKMDRYSFHPIHRRTRLYPHHGVPVLGSDKIDIVYFGEVITNPGIYTAVYYDKDTENAPFYFIKGRYRQ